MTVFNEVVEIININLVCVGKIKEKYIEEGMAEYIKRMKTYAVFKIIELKEEGNDKDREKAMEIEGAEIKKVLEKNKGLNILLDIKGKQYTTEEFVEVIENKMVHGVSTMNFIIGGSYGVTEEIRGLSEIKLSFSKFTFPHQLMRLIFLEQLYRWFSVINNSKYHK